MSEASVPGFTPSTHGFHFANAWPPGPTVRLGPLDPRIIGVGDASTGLCGGMVYTVADLFAAGVPVPDDREPPANGSPRFKSIVRRQVESLACLTVAGPVLAADGARRLVRRRPGARDARPRVAGQARARSTPAGSCRSG